MFFLFFFRYGWVGFQSIGIFFRNLPFYYQKPWNFVKSNATKPKPWYKFLRLLLFKASLRVIITLYCLLDFIGLEDTFYISSETTLILIYLSHGTKIDPKSPVFKVSHPKWTLSHSYGNFVFDHGPKEIRIQGSCPIFDLFWPIKSPEVLKSSLPSLFWRMNGFFACLNDGFHIFFHIANNEEKITIIP